MEAKDILKLRWEPIDWSTLPYYREDSFFIMSIITVWIFLSIANIEIFAELLDILSKN